MSKVQLLQSDIKALEREIQREEEKIKSFSSEEGKLRNKIHEDETNLERVLTKEHPIQAEIAHLHTKLAAKAQELRNEEAKELREKLAASHQNRAA